MKGIIRIRSGKEFSTMKIQEIMTRSLEVDEVKIKMKASRINPVDMDLMKGFPSLKYKSPQIGGVDGAGTILELGANVTDFHINDDVFFYRKLSDVGTWAEEITIPCSDIATIPTNLKLTEAGSICLPLLTAYESLISLHPKQGKRILIHGAGGGIGYQAVQLSKYFGLKVIVNASMKDKKILEKVGIEQFINYKTDDFVKILKNNPPDYIFDIIGKNTLIQSITLNPQKIVSVACPDALKMHKTGLSFPKIINWLINLMNRKFIKVAKKHQVELIGQVTGANGKILQEVSDIVSKMDFSVRSPNTIIFNKITNDILTLNKNDVGKVIIFD